ncbi:VOC family protein [Streptomyces kanamyceticus]|uniref:VOC family protein n=1 Tax=Streptomyces kanamyceticus TaxID=1967 RepID=A0A5J6G8A5_STRKN|nr:VOC family protein [Streptomyces kanamyceticus]QEU90021.1 VOC family protein [Streptomyces kanamyceticus]
MIRWAYAFIDRPRDRFPEAYAFWAAVTGARLSAFRGPDGEFVTLLPKGGGDAHLKAQAVGGSGGAHLDLAVDDLTAAAAQARALGADPVHAEDDLEVLRSPGGQLFCLVPWNGESTRPAPVAGPDGATARLDQVCLDTAPEAFDVEVAFWTALTGWESAAGRHPEFHALRPPANLPVRILLQRLGTPGASVAAHLDLACSDVDAVRTWHEGHGAEFVSRGAAWLVMRDPAGGTYCLTEREPWTGDVPSRRSAG